MTPTDPSPNRDKFCGGKKRGPEGGSCTRPAGWGTPHVGIGRCKLHGGSTPNSIIAAERILAAELAERYSVPRKVHPLAGVLEQYERYAGQVTYLEGLVNAIPPDELFFGVSEIVDRRGPDADGDEPGGERLRTGAAAEFEVKRKAGPNAKLEQFDKVQREYARLGVEIVKIGLESATRSVTEQVGARLATLVQALLADVAADVVATYGGDAAAVAQRWQPLAVARVVEMAGVNAVDGVAA